MQALNKKPKIFGIHAEPPPLLNISLAALPFILIIAIYLFASDMRLSENPDDKILPSMTQMWDAFERLAFHEDKRSGRYLFWSDTKYSLNRLIQGVFFAAFFGLWLGLLMGVFRGLDSLGASFVTFFAMIPPLAILPILLISFGTGELGKIILIFFGVFPVIARDIYLSVLKLPKEQITKALTLGVSQTRIVFQIVLPQIFPRLLESVRLSLGSAWLFLIAAEAIASDSGLGYRIFLMRRFLNMDIILPYVFWITIIGFFMDWVLRQWIHRRMFWYVKSKN